MVCFENFMAVQSMTTGIHTPCLHIVVDIAETTMTMWTLAVGLGLEGELPKSNIRNRIAKTKKTKVRKMC